MTDIGAIGVFCGSKAGADPAHEATARAFGGALAARGIELVFGGGGIGLMGVLADAVLDGGGRVVGVIPDFLVAHEVAHRDMTECVTVATMHERKERMFARADAFVVLAGGLGTLDETIEIITWKQLHLHAKPVVILDPTGYWQPFGALVDAVVAGGFAHPGIKDLFAFAADVDAVFKAISEAPPPAREVLTSHL